jgi:hypothetical protein
MWSFPNNIFFSFDSVTVSDLKTITLRPTKLMSLESGLANYPAYFLYQTEPVNLI